MIVLELSGKPLRSLPLPCAAVKRASKTCYFDLSQPAPPARCRDMEGIAGSIKAASSPEGKEPRKTVFLPTANRGWALLETVSFTGD